MFGTPGHGGQMGMGDLHHRLGWAYLTNHINFDELFQTPSYTPLEKAIYDTIIDIEEKEKKRHL